MDLTNPELTVTVEILPRDAFFGFDKIPGAGGLPVGASGRVVSLISGGIDSPVACLSHDAEGLPLDFRPLSQRSLSRQNLTGESAPASHRL